MAAFVKSIDSNHLLGDGLQLSILRADAILDPNIDILSTHHYESDAHQTVKNIRSGVKEIRSRKPYYIGEFGFFDLPGTEQIITTVISSREICGALIWSLRFHNRDGGFYWHSEPSGRGIFKAYHFPGFQTADEYNEREVMNLLLKSGWKIREIPQPVVLKPAAPVLLPISEVSRISWQGSVGAVDYLVERSEDLKNWQIVAASVCDAAFPYEPLYNDSSAKIGGQYYYRVSARNEAGQSSPSNLIGPVKIIQKALTDNLNDKSKIERIKGQATLENGAGRSFKEDLHRLAVENGSELIYTVPGPIVKIFLQSYIRREIDDVKIKVSPDDINYHEIEITQTDCTPANHDYKFWHSVLIQS
jgi:hypothetical protein